MTFSLDTRSHLLTFTFLVSFISHALAACRFPEFLQRTHPWTGDYKDGPLVAYVKPTFIMLREAVEGGTTIVFNRECVQRAPDNKFLVRHKEKRQPTRYLCMQFIQRGDNIVQVKTSDLFPRQSLEICDERGMAIDPFPLVQSGQMRDVNFNCPFTGGYNIYAYYPHPNNSIVCSNLLLLMRMESECDRGEGITFDFRKEECIPRGLPRNPVQRAHCVAHWTQETYTFIILQHAEDKDQWFCLRISDPLSNIRSAYLWLQVICDTSDRPSPEISSNYLRLELNKRIFSSTCEDELELCQEMKHYCSLPYGRHCAHTCRHCMSENQIGVCTFEEQYRGSWIESGTDSDTILNVEAYSLDAGQRGKYDCLNLESDKLKEKRVLLELYNNGCFPRYACVEMEKVTSSVMKFRLGDRLTWPLPNTTHQKKLICKMDNFQIREGIGSRYIRERPARLLVNTGNIKEVPCALPERLQNGIAFREDGKHCGGCLNYEPHITPNHFIIRPVNCSMESNENKGYRNMPIQYSCLASFEFYNNTFSVVTKTTSFMNGMGQYLVWIFTPENQIKVMKAADTYVFELNSMIKSDLIQAQFSILRNDNMQCRNFLHLPRSTSTTTTPKNVWAVNGNNMYQNNGDTNNNPHYYTGPTINGDEFVTYSPKKNNINNNNNKKNGREPPLSKQSRYDKSRGDNDDDRDDGTRCCQMSLFNLLCSVAFAVLFVVRTPGNFPLLNTT